MVGKLVNAWMSKELSAVVWLCFNSVGSVADCSCNFKCRHIFVTMSLFKPSMIGSYCSNVNMAISLAICTNEEHHPAILLLWPEVVPTAENSVKSFLRRMGTVVYGTEVCMSGLESSKAVV